TGEYNYPFVKHLLPGREIVILHMAYRTQGLLFAAGNPKHINGLTDLKRKDIRFINRQNGSGTRVLLDYELRQHGIIPSKINGYERELQTHLAVASSIAKGEADVGLGIEAAARVFNTGFLPLFRERYDLILQKDTFRSGKIALLLEIISGNAFKKAVTEAGGYDISQTGQHSFLKL
ncbi:MAG: molybdopterin biosynthesis protein, partial [Chloroflexi bacterium]|nr:molybdopterin biosynthesis protein [Chloroflexota bacterium]